MSMEIQFLAWDWHKNVSGSKLKNGITTLRLLDNWIYNDNTDKNKQKMSAQHEGSGKEKEQRLVDLGVSIMYPTSDTGSVDCCFCEIAPKSNFVCNSLVQRRHHYHLVNKIYVLPSGHLEFNNNLSLNIFVTAIPIQNHCNKT